MKSRHNTKTTKNKRHEIRSHDEQRLSWELFLLNHLSSFDESSFPNDGSAS